MQEIVLVLSSLVGVATAAAIRKMPKSQHSFGANSHINNQINSLRVEKDLLGKTISRLYQNDMKYDNAQREQLLSKYQHQMGVILAKLEKLEYSSKHPDFGPVGDGLLTLMDQKLSKLDERLHELSSKMTVASTNKDKLMQKEQVSAKDPQLVKTEQIVSKDKLMQKEQVAAKDTQLVKTEQIVSKDKLIQKEQVSAKDPQLVKTEQIVSKKETTKVEPTKLPEPPLVPESIKKQQIEPVRTKPKKTITHSKNQPKLDVTKNKDKTQEPKPVNANNKQDDDLEDDSDDINKIKGDIERILNKLNQAEVE